MWVLDGWLSLFLFLFLFLRRQPAVVRRSSHGPPSVADSAAEYFDASDDILCGSSSEVSDESGLSDGSTTNSEPEEGHGGYMYLCSACRVYRHSVKYVILISFIGSDYQWHQYANRKENKRSQRAIYCESCSQLAQSAEKKAGFVYFFIIQCICTLHTYHINVFKSDVVLITCI